MCYDAFESGQTSSVTHDDDSITIFFNVDASSGVSVEQERGGFEYNAGIVEGDD